MFVYKFGGTSIGAPEMMRRVAGLVNDNIPKIVVLSAIAGTTDRFEQISQMLFSEKKE